MLGPPVIVDELDQLLGFDSKLDEHNFVAVQGSNQ
jgi:hypothetical protein